VKNTISASKGDGENSTIDPTIVYGLQKMLDEHNVLAKTFRMARDRFKEDDYHEYTLKLISKREKSGTHNLPSASEVAALIVRDPNEESAVRDIIVDFKDMGHKGFQIYIQNSCLCNILYFPHLEKMVSHFKFRIDVKVERTTRERMSRC
jgi:hypothetical protein